MLSLNWSQLKSLLRRQLAEPPLFESRKMDALLRLLLIAAVSPLVAIGLEGVTAPAAPAVTRAAAPVQQPPPKPPPSLGRFPVLEQTSSVFDVSQLTDIFDASALLSNVDARYLDTFLNADDRPRMLIIMREKPTIDAHYLRICSSLRVYCLALLVAGAPPSTPIAEKIPQIQIDPASPSMEANFRTGAYLFDLDGSLIWYDDLGYLATTLEVVLKSLLSVHRTPPPQSVETPPPAQPRSIQTVSPTTLRELTSSVIPLGKPKTTQPFNETYAITQATKDKKPAMLVFWATWCAPCVAEAPDLGRLVRQFKTVTFIGLADDVNNEETRKRITALTASSGIQLQYLLTDRSLLRKIFKQEDTPLPAFAIFDPKVNVFRLTGSIKLTTNRKRLMDALRDAAQSRSSSKPGSPL
jgi:thiol-disulfide isomerase/thioredoxin